MSAVPMTPYLTPLPPIRTCKHCGKAIRRGILVDGRPIALEVRPTRDAAFMTISAWTENIVYVGEPDAGEFVPDAERFAKHVHASRGSQMGLAL